MLLVGCQSFTVWRRNSHVVWEGILLQFWQFEWVLAVFVMV